MDLRTKKALASGALAISLGALALGVAGVSPALATVDAPPADPIVSGASTTDLETSIESVDWCGWYMSGVAGSLVLENATGITTYNGVAIPLTAENAGLSAHVGGSSLYSDLENNCSWYGNDNKQAVAVTLTASGLAFEASLPGELVDTEMDFDLSGDNPLEIIVDEDSACTGFSTTDSDVIQGPDDLTSEPVTSAAYSLVGTNDICDWTISYEVNIPGGMVPTYGGVLYSYEGPTITTTLEIIETAP